MQDFIPGPYTEAANTATGLALWQFLNQTETLALLQVSTANRRPAIEGIQDLLFTQFGKEIKAEIWLRLITRMLRQVMEQQGYVREPRPMKIINGKLFKQGARYKTPKKPEVAAQ
jgi:hypothetical protein